MPSACTSRARLTTTWPTSSAAIRRRSTTRSSGSSGRSTRTSARAKFFPDRRASDLVIRCKADTETLIVSSRRHAQPSLPPQRHFADRDQVAPPGLWTEHREVVDLPLIVTLRRSRVGMVSVGAARVEDDRALPQSAGLALHASEARAVVDREVVAGVLPKRHEQVVTCFAKGKHDRERRPVALCLWMLHIME